MNSTTILGVSMTLSLTGWILIAQIWIIPALAKIPRPRALLALTTPHVFRFVGLSFLLHGVTAEPLDPRFAHPAAYGDLAAAILALIAVLLLWKESRFAIPSVWIFNVVGLVDLLNAVTQGIRYNDPALMGATYFIPTLAVPALVMTHVLIFRQLLRRDAIPRP
ncbi:MAG: hypothetical protein AAGC68_08290 [Verrucomicrobiota bacterium]